MFGTVQTCKRKAALLPQKFIAEVKTVR